MNDTKSWGKITEAMTLPVDYTKLTSFKKKQIREEYIRLQHGMCMFCKGPLDIAPMQDRTIDWGLFPPGFMNSPVHLQHNHSTNMTEGAVHAYCNAVMWQYYGR